MAQKSTVFNINIKSYRLDKYLTTPKRKSYFVVAVTVVFILVIIIGGIVPAYRSVVSQNLDNEKRRNIIAQQERKLSHLESLNMEKADSGAILGVFNDVFPEENPQASVIEEVSLLAVQNNVKIDTVNFSKLNRAVPLRTQFLVTDNVKSNSINIVGFGERTEIIDFIESLEKSTRIFNINSVSLKLRPINDLRTNQDLGDHAFTIDLEYYFTIYEF
jgi:hypothetical protein